MHYMYSANKRGVAIVCRPSAVCDIGAWGPHRLEILETNHADNLPNDFALRSPKAIYVFTAEQGGNFGETRVKRERDSQKFNKLAYL